MKPAIVTVRDSIQLAYNTFGVEQNPLVLLIPGAGAPAEFWPNEFCRDFAAAGRFVVRYSHRDTGLSTHVDELYPVEELLRDLAAFAFSFNNTNIHLVGHSMGGYLAQMAMCRFPKAFTSVKSISAGCTVSPNIAAELQMSIASEATWRTLWSNQPKGDFNQDLPGWLKIWRFLNGAIQFDETDAICYTRSLYVGDPRNAQFAGKHMHAMSTFPDSLSKELKEVVSPFLVIHGTQDPLVPLDNGEATARLVQNSMIHRLQGAGHMFFNRDIWNEIRQHLVMHTNNRAYHD